MPKYRHEYKHRIRQTEESILLLRATGMLLRDPHAGPDGSYVIRSLYFDDSQDTCLRENVDGTDPRSKFRIRYYNNDPSVLRLEKKSKCRMMTRKESCKLSIAECRCFLAGEIPAITEDMPEMKKQLLLEMSLRRLTPKVIVTYERIPFIYPGGNVRVTFDRGISSSCDVAAFLDGTYPVRPILPVGTSVLEIKWDEFLPKHIKNLLKMDTLQWSSFSKYYMCRRFHI